MLSLYGSKTRFRSWKICYRLALNGQIKLSAGPLSRLVAKLAFVATILCLGGVLTVYKQGTGKSFGIAFPDACGDTIIDTEEHAIFYDQCRHTRVEHRALASKVVETHQRNNDLSFDESISCIIILLHYLIYNIFVRSFWPIINWCLPLVPECGLPYI